MTAQTNYFSQVDPIHPGLNDEILQESPIILEIPEAMADDDTTVYTFPAAGDTGLPPRLVQVLRHTGGDLTNGADDNWNVSAGDTLILQIDHDGNGVYQEYTHSLSGGTDTAYTSAQVASSINADSALNTKILAVAELTANRVTIFPITPRGSIRVIGGTAQTVLLFPGTTVGWRTRTYVSQTVSVITAGTGWSWSYVASTRVLTVKNETGGTVNRVTVLVWR